MINAEGLLLIAFLLPFEPGVGGYDGASVVPQRLKHTAACRRFTASVNERLLIPPLRAIAPEYRVEAQRVILLVEEQHARARRNARR